MTIFIRSKLEHARSEEEKRIKDTEVASLEAEAQVKSGAEKSPTKEDKARAKMKKFACKQCHYRSSFRHGLQQHLKSTHNKVYHFACSLCDYRTYQRFDLNIHKKVHHETLRTCKLCDYDASSHDMLMDHIMSNLMTHVTSN